MPESAPLVHQGAVHVVRMGMSVAQAEDLADLLTRCPHDVRDAVHDQLWLRGLFTTYLKKMEHSGRRSFTQRCDRLLEHLDPRDPT